jgi:hypothetical protein
MAQRLVQAMIFTLPMTRMLIYILMPILDILILMINMRKMMCLPKLSSLGEMTLRLKIIKFGRFPLLMPNPSNDSYLFIFVFIVFCIYKKYFIFLI